MLRTLTATAVLACFAAPLQAQAASGNEMTITGQVVDVTCYAHGQSGAGHKMCAEACAKAGVQLAILGSDGTLYMPISEKAADPTNPRLTPFAEGKVKVTGKHKLVNGLHTIELKTVAAAS
jgi:type 1 fimbria pilin